jgi:hypothetical protein
MADSYFNQANTQATILRPSPLLPPSPAAPGQPPPAPSGPPLYQPIPAAVAQIQVIAAKWASILRGGK